MVNRLVTVYPQGSNKNSVRGSVWVPKFDMKHLTKAEGHMGRNNVSLIINMRSIVQIF